MIAERAGKAAIGWRSDRVSYAPHGPGKVGFSGTWGCLANSCQILCAQLFWVSVRREWPT